MRFRTYLGLAPLLAALVLGILAMGAGTAAAQSSATPSSSSSSSNSHLSTVSSNPTQSSAATNGSNTFSTQGTVGGPGGSTGGGTLSQPSAILPYLSTSPEMNGPGSLAWCEARSSCSLSANECASNCRENTLANGTAQSDSGEAGSSSATTGDGGQADTTTSITNYAANDCSNACQHNYQACSNQVSSNCSLSQ